MATTLIGFGNARGRGPPHATVDRYAQNTNEISRSHY